MRQYSASNYALSNARIYLMDAQSTTARYAHIQQGRMHSLFEDAPEQDSFDNNTEIIDLDGRTILPGLCDSHIHIAKYALMLDQVDCETGSIKECLSRIRSRCQETEPGTWVLGHGWNQNDWGRYGTREELDAISVDNPVYLTAKSLHAGWANSKALELCGITDNIEDPPRGKLQRDERGLLTGILYEDAVLLISTRIPKPDSSTLATKILSAQEKLNEWGITAIHDFDGLNCLHALETLEGNGSLHLRVLKHIRKKDFETALQAGLYSGSTGDWIRIGHLKLFADGALGPRTAAMLRGYEGEQENLGMLQLDVDEIVEIGRHSIQAGFPLAIHAIGDRANRTVLDAFEQLQEVKPNSPLPFPHRIEHAQLLHPEDLERPSRLGITVSMQPIHAISDQAMADQYWGERVRWSYAWNSQFKAGATVIFGSDAPVDSPNPWLGMHAAIARQAPCGEDDGASAWVAEERVSLIEALRAYSALPAQSACWDKSIGQLSKGCKADLIVLDQDPSLVKPHELKQLKPSGVMIDGEWVIRNF